MDAMVTARMPQSKKDAGNEVLSRLGFTASGAINELYDYLLENQSWPLSSSARTSIEPQRLVEALAYIDNLACVPANEYVDMSVAEAKQQRLISKGRALEVDFA